MTHEQAEQIVMNLTKPVFGFARSRTESIQDAEDIAQEVVLKIYRALLTRDDIAEPEKFAWTIAHNTLANYYRSRAGYGSSVPIHGLAEVLPADGDITARIEESETVKRLHNEIAYLSKTRRQIVIMHYFEGKRQKDIADALNLPLGTVKWHISNAKTDLQKGMEIMRTTSELKFNPIKFNIIGTNGSAGNMGDNGTYLRSILGQNILYLIRQEAMPVNEIADALGVSPVYVEGELEFLEENGFALKQGKGYIANALIEIPTTESNRLVSDMHEKAANLLAPALFDALAANIKLGEDGVICPRNDMNFALWAIIPYITAWSGTLDEAVSFQEVATIRPDGGHNICYCAVHNPDATPMKYSESLRAIRGPSWNGGEDFRLWFMDTMWGGNRAGNYHPDIANRDLSSLKAFFDTTLSDDEIIWMAERGYISRTADAQGCTYDRLDIVWLTGEANKRLINLANDIREKYKTELSELKSAHNKIYLEKGPEHLKKAWTFCLQHTFHSDCIFIIHMINKLLESGKLQLPTEEQRKSLCAVVVTV